MKSLFKTGRTAASMSKYLCLGMIFDICVLFQPWSLVHGWEKLSSLHTFWEPHFLWTLCATAIEWFPGKAENPWCTDVSRSLTRFPSRSAHARERDAENPPWWGACVEIPSCRVRMRSNCLPAWQVNVLRTLLRLDSRLDRVLTRQQLTAEKEKRKTT